MVNKVLFVNHLQERCGIYQYGKRLFNCLMQDDRYEHEYVATNDKQTFIETCQKFQPDVIIFNWHEATMRWFTRDLNYINNAKQFIVFHEGAIPLDIDFDGCFSAAYHRYDPSQSIYSIPRPLIEFNPSVKQANTIPSIGSFGFGFVNKGFEKVCSLVQDQFNEASLKLHITTAHFGQNNDQTVKNIINYCKHMVTKPGIELAITTDFISDDSLLNFLHSNEINIFMYDDEPHRRAHSSVIDYVVSAQSCFAVNSSSMFSHLGEHWDSVNIDKTNIQDIIDRGNSVAIQLQQQWSDSNVRDSVYEVIKGL
jgi:hypothetical protein